MASNLKGFLPEPAFVMAKKVARVRKPVSTHSTPHPPSSSKLPAFQSLAEIQSELAGCTRCKLCEKRKTIVFGEGNPNAELLFVGEGPGENEDLQGRPFVGKAGQLLEKMIEAMGKKRSDVYIANVVKCRPPGNRTPEPDEVATCMPFLQNQIRILKPKVIVALGKTAIQGLLKQEGPMARFRGKVLSYDGTKLIATFHPSYLLRNPPAKKDAWADLQFAMKELGWKLGWK